MSATITTGTEQCSREQSHLPPVLTFEGVEDYLTTEVRPITTDEEFAVAAASIRTFASVLRDRGVEGRRVVYHEWFNGYSVYLKADTVDDLVTLKAAMVPKKPSPQVATPV